MSISQSLRFFSLVVLFLLSLGCARTHDIATKLGNGEGFGGGDPFGGKLLALRNEVLLPAAQGIAAGEDIEGLCELSRCPADEPVCKKMSPLSPSQVLDCQAFMEMVAPALVQSLSSKSIAVSGSSERLYSDENKENEVTALVSLSRDASIRVSYPRYQDYDLDDAQLAAALGHEFLHTVELAEAGGFIGDNFQFRSFSGVLAGSRLLDVVGVMLVSYYLRNGVMPGLLSPSSLVLDHGHVKVGQQRGMKLVLSNNSGAPAEQIVFGSISAPFTLVSHEDCPSRLDRGDSCEVEVEYAPTLLEPANSVLNIFYEDSRKKRSLEIALRGKGAEEVVFAGTAGLVRRLDPFTGVKSADPIPGPNDSVASTAACDVNGDGYVDMVIGAGHGSRPILQVYSGKDDSLLYEREAYSSGFLGGVNVSCTDLNGDGFGDVLTGAGVGGGPHAKAFSGQDGLKSELANFFAFDASYVYGIQVAAGNLDGIGPQEIVVATGIGHEAMVRVFALEDGEYVHRADEVVYSPGTTAVGVSLAVANTDGNTEGRMQVITGATNHGPHVKIYSFANNVLSIDFEFYAHSYLEGSGIRLTTMDSNADGISEIFVQSNQTGHVTIWDPAQGFTGPIGGFIVDGLFNFSIGLR